VRIYMSSGKCPRSTEIKRYTVSSRAPESKSHKNYLYDFSRLCFAPSFSPAARLNFPFNFPPNGRQSGAGLIGYSMRELIQVPRSASRIAISISADRNGLARDLSHLQKKARARAKTLPEFRFARKFTSPRGNVRARPRARDMSTAI